MSVEGWRRVAGLAVVVVLLVVGVFCVPAGATVCGNEVLRGVLGSGSLPDCRAYEMVTPPYKEGYPAFQESIAPNGDQMLMSGLGDLAGVAGEGEAR